MQKYLWFITILLVVFLLSQCAAPAPVVKNSPPSKPANPNPANGANGIDITPTLSWNCSDPDSDTLTFDIYFGTNSNPPLLKSNHTSTNYQTNTLNYNTTYYWKIVAKDNKGASTVGDVWSFTTEMMTGLRILKKIKLDGSVYSSPAVGTDGNIYIGSQVGYFVIDPQNYEIVENVSTEPIWCSPVVDETTGKVYFASSDGKIHIYPDKLSYEISDSSIYPRLYSAPVLYEDYLYIIDTEGELIRVNKSDLFDKTIVLETDFSVRPSAVIRDGNMYFASQYGSVVKVSLSNHDSERLIFDVDSFQGGFTIALDGTLFVSGTTIWALDPDADSIQIPKWYYAFDSQTYANPVLSEDDIIYVRDALGTLYALEAKGGLYWKKMNLGSIYSSCVISDNKIIYVAAGNQLLAIDPQNHDVIDSVELEGHVESNPVLYDGKLFVADTEGYLYIISALSDTIQDPDSSWPMYQKDLYHSGKRWRFLIILGSKLLVK
ncbi:MAG: PQQ-binding-like beta-propeller repeat protein [Pseudothermotoga sp.]